MTDKKTNKSSGGIGDSLGEGVQEISKLTESVVGESVNLVGNVLQIGLRGIFGITETVGRETSDGLSRTYKSIFE